MQYTREEKANMLRDLFARDGWRLLIEPALKARISALQREWLNSGPDTDNDKILKGKVIMACWMLEWPDRLNTLLTQMDEDERVREATEDHGRGGSPY